MSAEMSRMFVMDTKMSLKDKVIPFISHNQGVTASQ